MSLLLPAGQATLFNGLTRQTLYLGALTTLDDGAELTGVVAPGYARAPVLSAAWAINAQTGVVSNNTIIVFPSATAAWPAIRHFGLYGTQTGGTLLMVFSLPDAFTVPGDATLRIPPGRLVGSLSPWLVDDFQGAENTDILGRTLPHSPHVSWEAMATGWNANGFTLNDADAVRYTRNGTQDTVQDHGFLALSQDPSSPHQACQFTTRRVDGANASFGPILKMARNSDGAWSGYQVRARNGQVNLFGISVSATGAFDSDGSRRELAGTWSANSQWGIDQAITHTFLVQEYSTSNHIFFGAGVGRAYYTWRDTRTTRPRGPGRWGFHSWGLSAGQRTELVESVAFTNFFGTILT